MKSLITILYLCLFCVSCDLFEPCNCDYVVYDSNPSNNYTWTQSYRSTWDYCEEETLNESVYTDFEGQNWYSRTEIECD